MALDTWKAGSGDWFTAADWSGGVPSSASNVVIAPNGFPTLTSAAPISIATLTLDAGSSLSISDTPHFSVAGQMLLRENSTSLGTFNLDTGAAQGGSNVTIGGLLVNYGAINLGNGSLSHSDTVTVAGLYNIPTAPTPANPFPPSASLALAGEVGGPNRMLLDVKSVAEFGPVAGALNGRVTLAGDAAITFASGQITTINGFLGLSGPKAFVADSALPNSNSALRSLRAVAGFLELSDGAIVATTQSLTETKTTCDITLDGAFGDPGGSQLTVLGTLGIAGALTIDAMTKESSAHAGALYVGTNAYVVLRGASTGLAALAVGGATANYGHVILVADAHARLVGAVTGPASFSANAGTFSINGGSTLEFASSVAKGQSIDFAGPGLLEFDSALAAPFSGAINTFGVGDELEVRGFGTGTRLSYVENSAHTAGVLTLKDGSSSAHYDFNGNYTASEFSLSIVAGGTASLVKFV